MQSDYGLVDVKNCRSDSISTNQYCRPFCKPFAQTNNYHHHHHHQWQHLAADSTMHGEMEEKFHTLATRGWPRWETA